MLGAAGRASAIPAREGATGRGEKGRPVRRYKPGGELRGAAYRGARPGPRGRIARPTGRRLPAVAASGRIARTARGVPRARPWRGEKGRPANGPTRRAAKAGGRKMPPPNGRAAVRLRRPWGTETPPRNRPPGPSKSATFRACREG